MESFVAEEKIHRSVISSVLVFKYISNKSDTIKWAAHKHNKREFE